MPPKVTPHGKSAGTTTGSASSKQSHAKPGARPTRFATSSGGGSGRGAVVVNTPSNYFGVRTTRGAVEVSAPPAHRGAVRVNAAPTAEERRLFEPMYAWDWEDRFGSDWLRPWRRSRSGGRSRSDGGHRLVLHEMSGLGQTTLDTATTVGWVAVTLLAAGVYFVVTSDVKSNRRRRRR